MPVLTPAVPVATVDDAVALTELMAEPEAAVGDAPAFCPPAGLLVLLLLSPATPKEPQKR